MAKKLFFPSYMLQVSFLNSLKRPSASVGNSNAILTCSRSLTNCVPFCIFFQSKIHYSLTKEVNVAENGTIAETFNFSSNISATHDTDQKQPVDSILKKFSLRKPMEFEYEYIVKRTIKGKRLPIYTDYKNGRMRVLTIVRRVDGNLNTLCSDLRKIFPSETTISLRSDLSQVIIKGNHVKYLRRFFTEMGF